MLQSWKQSSDNDIKYDKSIVSSDEVGELELLPAGTPAVRL